MDLRTLTLTARNMAQGRATYANVLVVVYRTHIGWQPTYFVDGEMSCARKAEKAIAAYDKNNLSPNEKA